MATFWIGLCAALWLMLSAAVKEKQEASVKDFNIQITGGNPGEWFLEKNDVLKLIGINDKNDLENIHISTINLVEYENKLKKNPWTKHADVYIDNNLVLQIHVKEKRPVARVFNISGHNFYVDENAGMLPLTNKAAAKLPVFTSFRGNYKNPQKADSAMLQEISILGGYLLKDNFWGSQVQQIDMNNRGEFEMIPLLGKHTIEFGTAEGYEEKFKRLFIFYKNVLAKTGFEKYKIIKAQYEGQIVGVRRNPNEKEPVKEPVNIENDLVQSYAGN